MAILAALSHEGIAGAQSKTTTATNLALTSGDNAVTTVSSGSVVTLTATVTAGTLGVTPGQVNFCDASTPLCTDIHLLGTAQLTNAGTAAIRFRPGIGTHSYRAVFAGTNSYATSSSSSSTLQVTGSIGVLPTSTTIDQSGSWGAYTLSATVTEVGGTLPLSGGVSFLDTSNGNAILKTAPLGSSVAGLAWPAPQTLPLDYQARAISVGDFNADGIPDLVTAAGNSIQSLLILLRNADGTYTTIQSSAISAYAINWIGVADFNNDGKQDLAILNGDNQTLAILLGNGDGTFAAAPASSPTTGSSRRLAIADFNGDGILDVAVVSLSNVVTIYLGVGDGTFTAVPSTTSINGIATSIVTGDFDGDGNIDLALTEANDDAIWILLGKGDGTFSASNSLHSGSSGSPIAVGDFNGDGKLDLLAGYQVAIGSSDSLNLITGNGDGTFTSVPLGQATNTVSISSILSGDFNADGIPDAVLMDQTSGYFTVFLGDGSGAFTTRTQSPSLAANYYFLYALADFNGDGRTDLAISNNYGSYPLVATIYYTSPTQTASTAAGISLPVPGEHQVAASYGGDANYSGSTSGNLSLWGVPPVTTTTLTVTAGGSPVSSIAYGTAVTLTATVAQATTGQVNFCDASAIYCSDVHVIGSAALTSNGTATFKFVPGTGAHSYKAVFLLNGSGQNSTSNKVSLTVGSAPSPVYTDAAAISYAGIPGAYSLTGTVTGYGGPAPLTGSISFVDTSFGNNVLGTATLGASTAGLGWRIGQSPLIANYPISEAAADLNGDGVPDLAIVWNGGTPGTYSVTTLLGNGDGTFTTGISSSALPNSQITKSQTVTNLIAGDFNGDGKTDLVMLSYDDSFYSSVTVLLGNGDGSFGLPQTSAGYSRPNSGGTFYSGAMAKADFNGDGKLDLAVSGDCITACGFTILLGNGDGTFKTATTFLSEQYLRMGAIGDLNGDGIPDLIVSRPNSGGTSQIMTLLGKGDGTFSYSASVITLNTMPSSVLIGDFNSDGKLDLALGKVFNELDYDTFIYFGNGDGTFTAAPGNPLPGAGNYLLAGDFNHDGKVDLAGLDDPIGDGTVYISIYAGAGDGTFTRRSTTPPIGNSSTSLHGLVSVDFNGDGASDLGIITSAVKAVSILSAVPTQTASSTISNVAPVGASTHNVNASYSGDGNYGAAISGTVALQPGLAPLLITPPSGNYTSSQTVTISELIPGASIFYTLTGSGVASTPITPYTGPIALDHGGYTTLRALVSENGYYTPDDAFAYYALTLPVVPTPVITPASGSYPGAQTVTITDSMPGTTIYYRTDGAAPTLNSTVYTGPFTVSAATTITAIGAASGYTSSAVASSQILIGSSQSRYIYTIGGNTGWGYAGDGGQATAAALSYPMGTVVDSAGNIYFAEQGNHRVRKIAAGSGTISTVAGNGVAGYSGDNGPAVNAQLNYPGALALDAAGNLYIADVRNYVVRKLTTSTGIITTFAGNPTATSLGDNGPATSAQLRSPWGLAVDGSGNLYIADLARIRKVSGGIITTIAGTGISGTAGNNGPAINAQIYNAAGIALDSASNLYIADIGRNVIRKVTASTGIISTIAGNGTLGYGGDGGPAVNSILRNPNYVAVDNAGNIYIADTGNSVVREITASDGYINTIAGSYGNCTTVAGDGGPAPGAGICSPEGLSLDGAGNVIVAESASHRIRMVTVPIAPPTATTATPVFSVSGGTYAGAQSVAISDATPGAEIYVTLNGVPVTTASAAYRGTIQVTGSGTLQAMAVAPGYLPSAAAVATYTITTPPTAVINTIAGNGMVGGTAGGGLATSTPLSTPIGVAVDSKGNVYIADGNNHVVWKVDSGTGTISVVAGQLTLTGPNKSGDGGLATGAILSSISDVAIDAADNLYISDSGFSVIRKVDHNTGIISTFAGTGQASSLTLDGSLAVYANLSSPRGIAFDSAGNLYIADNGFNRVRVVSAATGIMSTVAGNGSASGISGDGGPATVASIAAPTDVALDRAGNLYIADAGYARIRRVDHTTGFISTFAGNGNRGATGDGKLATAAEISPNGLAVDGAGNVYFSNPGEGIRMVPAGGGIVTTVVGNGYSGFGGDGGAATMAEVSAAGLAFDRSGSLYIADLINSRVRKVTYSVATDTPTFSLATGTYSTAQTVSITDSTPSATIYYTTDGSTPSTGSSLYNGPIAVSSTTTLQAIAIASGFASSAIASATYTISNATAPVISWPTPAAIMYGTQLGTAELSATTTVPGTFVYSPAAGSMLNAGQQILSVTFTPTDRVNYTIATASVVLTVNKAPLTVAVNNASMTYGATLPTLTGSVSGVVPGDGITASYATSATSSSSAGSYPITATLNDPNSKLSNYVVTNTSGTLTIGRSTSNVVWAAPSAIVYGTPLNAVQLNAVADVPGSFVYSPAAGTVLAAGAQTLSVTWSPTDSVDYAPVTKTVQLLVNKAPLTVRANDASMIYGGALPTFSGTLIGIVAGDGITASFSSTATSSSTVGSYPITAVLNDIGAKLSNYTVTNTSGSLTITKATPLISWPPPLGIAYGTALSAVQLNASSTTSGTFVYAPAAGTVLSVGQHTLAVNFTPNDAVDYNATSAYVSLSVTAAVPSISAVGSSSNPSLISTSITFTATVTATGGAPTGTMTFKDGTTQLASVAVNAGVATYSTSSLAAGAHSISAVYSGDSNYASITSAVLTQIVESYSIGVGTGSSTVNATPGGQATFTLQVTPPSVGSALTFSVSGLPSGATATFSPSTVATGSAPTNVTLTIGVPTTATAQPVERPFKDGSLPIALGLILLPLARRLRRVSRTLRSFVALCLIGFVVTSGTIACGGGGASGGSKTPTPRTYTLTVTASSGSLTQTTILTLNVG